MKSISFKAASILCIVILLAGETNAQRHKSPKTLPTGQQPKTINDLPSTFGNLPIIIDSSAMADTIVAKSNKPPGIFDAKVAGNRIPMPYEDLRRDDALYAQKVWRELDLREKINQVFRYDETDDNGSQLFISMLLRAVKTGEVSVFADDRFSIPLTAARVVDMTQGQLDTVLRYNPSTMVPDAYIVTRASFDARSVVKIRILEEWVFDRESSRMFCRILGIAPLKTEYYPNTTKERGSSVMFWTYYPDLRPVLANSEVYNPKNMGQSRMTWEELFESRMFSSYIMKSTLDNAANRYIRSYIKDPILALLEGDNIKEKIFNYEQDLWSY
jgi:gliding motility associated protien GldN